MNFKPPLFNVTIKLQLIQNALFMLLLRSGGERLHTPIKKRRIPIKMLLQKITVTAPDGVKISHEIMASSHALLAEKQNSIVAYVCKEGNFPVWSVKNIKYSTIKIV